MTIITDVSSVESAQTDYSRAISDVERLRLELERAQSNLTTARANLQVAQEFSAIIAAINSKIALFPNTYRSEQLAKFIAQLGESPEGWSEQDFSKFNAGNYGQWLRGKAVLNTDELMTYLKRFRNAGGEVDGASSRSGLEQFAKILIDHLDADDKWPPYEIKSDGGYLLTEISIQFAT